MTAVIIQIVVRIVVILLITLIGVLSVDRL